MKFTEPLTFVVWREGKSFVSQCLNVDVSSFGPTYEDALLNGKEAVELFLEDAKVEEVQKVDMPSITMTLDSDAFVPQHA